MEPSKRLIDSEIIGVEIIADILGYHSTAFVEIRRILDRFYDRYAQDDKLTNSINERLTVQELREFKQEIRDKLRRINWKLSDLYDKGEIEKLTRLQALQDEIEIDLRYVGVQEEDRSIRGYELIIAGSFVLAGAYVVGEIPRKTIKEVMQTKWIERGNWYDRMWKNNKVMRNEVRGAVREGIKRGWGNDKMARMLDDRVGVGKYRSTRLVRTESNYMMNQATLQRFKADGVKYYRFDATLDGRTSDECMALDGQVFKVEDAVVGVNYPPLHINCRSEEHALPDESFLEENDRVSTPEEAEQTLQAIQ